MAAIAAMTPRVDLITVLGAECSGKTTLCDALGQSLGASVVPEYLRQWCERTGRTPGRDEQRSIAAGQLALTRQALARARARGERWVVCDSAPLLTAAYGIEYFGDDSLVETGLRHARATRLTLLADPDIAWRADGHLRDGPARRASVHRILLDLLQREGIAHHRIAGTPERRLRDCLALLR